MFVDYSMKLMNKKHFEWDFINVFYKIIDSNNSNNDQNFSEKDLLVNSNKSPVDLNSYYDKNLNSEIL
jgi:hypothetical protein